MLLIIAPTADATASRRGTTRILITHQTQWLHACDRVLVLRCGAVVADGAWADLRADPAFAAVTAAFPPPEAAESDADASVSAAALDARQRSVARGPGSPAADAAPPLPDAKMGSSTSPTQCENIRDGAGGGERVARSSDSDRRGVRAEKESTSAVSAGEYVLHQLKACRCCTADRWSLRNDLRRILT